MTYVRAGGTMQGRPRCFSRPGTKRHHDRRYRARRLLHYYGIQTAQAVNSYATIHLKLQRHYISRKEWRTRLLADGVESLPGLRRLRVCAGTCGHARHPTLTRHHVRSQENTRRITQRSSPGDITVRHRIVYIMGTTLRIALPRRLVQSGF